VKAALKFISYCFAAFAVLVACIGVELTSIASDKLMIIASPFGDRSALDVVAAADGRIMRLGRWSWIAVAANDGPDVRGRLRTAGALWVGPVLADVLCGERVGS
jgi:hypothetical protein